MMMWQFYSNLSKKLKKKQLKWLGEEFQTTGKPSKQKLLSFFPYEEQPLMGEMGCETNTQIDVGKFWVKRACTSFPLAQHSQPGSLLGKALPAPSQHSGAAPWRQRNMVPKKDGLQTVCQQGLEDIPRRRLLRTVSQGACGESSQEFLSLQLQREHAKMQRMDKNTGMPDRRRRFQNTTPTHQTEERICRGGQWGQRAV